MWLNMDAPKLKLVCKYHTTTELVPLEEHDDSIDMRWLPPDNNPKDFLKCPICRCVMKVETARKNALWHLMEFVNEEKTFVVNVKYWDLREEITKEVLNRSGWKWKLKHTIPEDTPDIGCPSSWFFIVIEKTKK